MGVTKTSLSPVRLSRGDLTNAGGPHPPGDRSRSTQRRVLCRGEAIVRGNSCPLESASPSATATAMATARSLKRHRQSAQSDGARREREGRGREGKGGLQQQGSLARSRSPIPSPPSFRSITLHRSFVIPTLHLFHYSRQRRCRPACLPAGFQLPAQGRGRASERAT